jgi:HAD superfamily hydrolase (TIGR01509 family)
MAPGSGGRAHDGVDLDALNSHWRLAIHAAQDALQAVARCEGPLHFPGPELHDHVARLARERGTTARLLDAIAREEHLRLRRELDAPWADRHMLGLDDGIAACVFDLDGVLTGSEAVHSAAWAETFDPPLARRAERTGERFGPYRPFTARDYVEHIHGRPRVEGIHAFLASRGIRLPEGAPNDPPGTETVYGLANRKNDALARHLEREGVTAFEGSLLFLQYAAEAEVPCAVVTASANARAILSRAGLSSLVGPIVDGNAMSARALRRKPAPDTLEAACEALGVPPAHTAAFETTLAGLRAAQGAGIGLVVGVERPGRPDSLAPADLVVRDLAELLDPVLTADGFPARRRVAASRG